MADVKPGMRLLCQECGTEVVIIKADGAVPSCCGQLMVNRAQTQAGAR